MSAELALLKATQPGSRQETIRQILLLWNSVQSISSVEMQKWKFDDW
jgi:hypothetical protein